MRQILLLALVAFLIFFPFYSYAQDDTKSNPQVETQQIIDIETEKDDNESKEIDIDKLDIRQ
ncbi:hypothetical protein IJJ97_02285, partial [bacterium]|nr:hypothetical protein [bacterium]